MHCCPTLRLCPLFSLCCSFPSKMHTISLYFSMIHSPRARLVDGIRRMRRVTYVTRRGLTQIYSRWRPPYSLSYVANPSDSSSGSDESGDLESDLDEDEIDFSIVSETLSFSWVESDDDERNYALYHYREFFQQSLDDESTLRDLVSAVESSILEALGGERLRAKDRVSTVVTEAFAGLRVQLSELYSGQRYQFQR